MSLTMHLLDLPAELLCQIADFLSPKDILAIRATQSRRLINATIPAFARNALGLGEHDEDKWKWLSRHTLNVLEAIAATPAFVPYVTCLYLSMEYQTIIARAPLLKSLLIRTKHSRENMGEDLDDSKEADYGRNRR